MVQQWSNGLDIYFNLEKCPLKTEDFVSALDYARWIIKERMALEIRYAGETSQHHIDGAAILKFADWEEFQEYGYADWQKFMDTRGIAAKYGDPSQQYLYIRVLLNVSWVSAERGMDRRIMRTLIHELLHCFEVPHSSFPEAVMAKNLSPLSPVTYGLKCDDMMAGQRGGDQRFVELNREKDLWIPCVQGKMADLQYVGDHKNGHKWRLRSLLDAGPMQVESAVGPINPEKPDLTFTDVRTPGMKLSLVKLDYDLATEIWTLVHAE